MRANLYGFHSPAQGLLAGWEEPGSGLSRTHGVLGFDPSVGGTSVPFLAVAFGTGRASSGALPGVYRCPRPRPHPPPLGPVPRVR